jgi:hypothetical protein
MPGFYNSCTQKIAKAAAGGCVQKRRVQNFVHMIFVHIFYGHNLKQRPAPCRRYGELYPTANIKHRTSADMRLFTASRGYFRVQ